MLSAHALLALLGLRVVKCGDDQVGAAGSLTDIHDPLVLPCVDVGPLNRLLIREYVLKTLYDFSAASFEHRAQNNRNFEGLGELTESNHVVHDHRRFVTVKVRELQRLMIDEENDALLPGQQSPKPRHL